MEPRGATVVRPASPPMALPTTWRIPRITRHTLPNGIQLWIVRSSRPLTSAYLSFPVGGRDVAASAAGLPYVLFDALANQVAASGDMPFTAYADALGARIGSSTGPEQSGMTLVTQPFSMTEALGLLSRTVKGEPGLSNSAFDESLARTKAKRARQASVDFLQGWAAGLQAIGFGGVSMPVYGTTSSLTKLTLEDALHMKRCKVRPEVARLFISSSNDEDSVVAAATAAFGDWSPSPVGSDECELAVPELTATDPSLQGLRSVVVSSPQAKLVTIVIVAPGPVVGHRLAPSAEALANLLGERLGKKLTGESGMAYTTSGGLTWMGSRSVVMTMAVVAPERAQEALAAMLEIWSTFPGAVSDSEYAAAERAYLTAWISRVATSKDLITTLADYGSLDLKALDLTGAASDWKSLLRQPSAVALVGNEEGCVEALKGVGAASPTTLHRLD